MQMYNILVFHQNSSFCILLKSQVKLYYERRSVGQSVLVSSSHLGHATNFFSPPINYFQTHTDLMMLGALSDEKLGSVFFS
jgi:hypothetical protein